MSARDNIELQNELYNAFSDNRFDRVLELTNENVEVVLYPMGLTFKGRKEFVQFMQGWKSAFPDIRIHVTNQVAEDAKVTAEFVATGTHTGTLRTPDGDISPTGKKVELNVCEVWDVRDGKLSRIRNYQDSGSLLRQIGVL